MSSTKLDHERLPYERHGPVLPAYALSLLSCVVPGHQSHLAWRKKAYADQPAAEAEMRSLTGRGTSSRPSLVGLAWARMTYRACAIAFVVLALAMLRQVWISSAVPMPKAIQASPNSPWSRRADACATLAHVIFWKIVDEHVRTGRTEFTLQGDRLDSTLQLPNIRDNLEARLVLLRRRLEERSRFLKLVPASRGRFHLDVQGRRALELVD